MMKSTFLTVVLSLVTTGFCEVRPAAWQYPPLAKTQVTGGFWAPRFRLWRTKTVSDVLTKLETRSRIGENLRLAAAGAKGGHHGPFFFDGLLCEAVCGASDYLAQCPDPTLESHLDRLIDKIVAAQRPDGYLNTRVQLTGEDRRWGACNACGLDQHEIYDAGCLLEAGIHYYRATGKTKLLAAGIRFANLLCATIGPAPKRNLIPGHSLTEDVIVQFADLLAEDPSVAAKTGFPAMTAKPYLDLVGYWLGNHGNNCGSPDWEKLGPWGAISWCVEETKTPHPAQWRPSYGDYQMDKKPLSEYAAIEGHAVRATLLCTGLAAYARATGSEAYGALATRFWESMVGRKMYISGGVGAEAGLERFVEDYRLPSDAYLETCAAIGSAFFSLRMAELTGDGRYFDEVERVAYNALLTAVGANGTTYTYQNPLNTKKGSRWDWHGCPCCPPMFLKMTGRLPSVACARDAEGFRVNLFMDGAFDFPNLRITQETRYPEEGTVRIRMVPTAPRVFALRVRVPGWARGSENPFGLYASDAKPSWKVSVNGKAVAAPLEAGYAILRREWRAGDSVELDVDVGERIVRADNRVADVRGKTARMRGPVLMARENGKWIPYYDVANRGPAPHEVWVDPPRAKAQLLRDGWMLLADPKHEMSVDAASRRVTQAGGGSRTVSLPYTANVHDADGTSMWLVRDFETELAVSGNERVYLELGGVNYRCRAWLDGRLLGAHDGSVGSFRWDITEKIVAAVTRRDAASTGVHRLVLNVETCPKGGKLDGLTHEQLPIRFGSAYVQEVPRLVVKPVAFVDDVFVRTDPATGTATVRVTAQNAGKAPARVRLSATIAEAGDDAAIDVAEVEITLPPGTREHALSLRVPDVRLWSPSDPRLYRVRVTLGGDAKSVRVGYRDLRVDDEGYFTLNGKRTFIKCCHTGPYFPDAQFSNMNPEGCRRHLLYFKACGFNAIRYIYSTSYPEMLDLCDEIGLMVYEEHPYAWLKKKSDRTDAIMLRSCGDVLKRDRNHASFTLFGMLNETEWTDEKSAIDEAAVKSLPELRKIAPDPLILLHSGRWDGQLGIASASNPGSSKWDAWMGEEGPDKDTKPHAWSCDGVGDVHYYCSHPVEAAVNRTAYERAFSHRRAAFMSESGAGSSVNMVAAYLKFAMHGWSKTANQYDCVREHALGFRTFFDDWKLNAIWPTPEAFVFSSQEYQARQRRLVATFVRRNPKVNGFSITMSADMGFKGEGMMDADASFKRGTSDMLDATCADLMFCLVAKDSCVFDTAGLDLDAALSDFGMLKPGVKYPVRLRVTSREGVKWEKKVEVEVEADAKGRTPTMTKLFSGHLDTKGWRTGDYVFSAEFLEGAYATCGEKAVHIIAAGDVNAALKGVKVSIVGTNAAERAKCESLVKAAGGEVVVESVDAASRRVNERAVEVFRSGEATRRDAASTVNERAVESSRSGEATRRDAASTGETIFVSASPLSDAAYSNLVAAAENGARVVFADAAVLAGKDGKLRLPFAKNATIRKEWNWLYHWDAIVHESALTAGVKNRMICDTEYFGGIWTDRCVCGLPPADEIGLTCAYLGIDGNRTKSYYDGLEFGAYRVGKGAFVLSTLPLNANDPVSLRLWANALNK